MAAKLKRVLIGRPLKNESLHGEKYGVLFGLPILASDPISSVAYASEEVLLVLVPAIGLLAYPYLSYISLAIIGLLVLLTFSYRQTIQSYPSGGGAYIVASDNLGKTAGVIAGAALAIDYILTVSVSVSSGVAAITSAFPTLYPYTVPLCLVALILLMVGNLRGIKESARLFSLPTYAFVFAMLAMIVMGVYKVLWGGFVPMQTAMPAGSGMQTVTVMLVLTAFSNGCAALTGVEAVSNAVPNFKKPSAKNAKTVMLILSLSVLLLFGGSSLLANLYHIVPKTEVTVLSQIAGQIFGNGAMFYLIQATTALILIMAANTAFSDFPLLISIMAREGYCPRQLSMRGDRLSYSNGIILLAILAGILIFVFQAHVSSLIGLYAIGVFISFTLSQSGMFMKWIRSKEKHWHYKAFINGFGALVTAIVVLIIARTKFLEGAWIVIIVLPALMLLLLRVKKHYNAIAAQLRLTSEEIDSIDIIQPTYRNSVIVPIESINKASVRALRFARTISPHVTAFNVSIDPESGEHLRDKYNRLHTDIPLIIKYSPFRKVVDPLMKFIESEEYDYKKGDMITVILPQFTIRKWWQSLLHNNTRYFIERELLKHKHIVIATMPLQLKEDNIALKKAKRI